MGKHWIVIGAILSCLVILVFVFLRPFAPSLTSKPERAVALVEKKVPLPVVENKPQEPLKEIANPESTQGPKETLSPQSIKGQKRILTQSKGLQEGKAPPAIEPSVEKKKEETPKKQVSVKKKVREVKLSTPRPKVRNVSPVEQVKPSLPAPLKEEALSKPTEDRKRRSKGSAQSLLRLFTISIWRSLSLTNERR